MGNKHSNGSDGAKGSNGRTNGLQITTTTTPSSLMNNNATNGTHGPLTVEQRLIAANKGMTRTESGANLQEQRFGNQLQPIEKLAKVSELLHLWYYRTLTE